MRVSAQGIRVSLGGRLILGNASLVAESGQMVGVIGPNGSGKTTLLRTVYRAIRPQAGLIELDGTDLRSLSTRAAARYTAVLAQENNADFDLTVEETVRQGRTPHKRSWERDTGADRAIVDESMRRVGLTAEQDRLISTLSGGERQRVLVARALAQQSRVLLLDEPTNHLDIRHQLELLELLRDLGKQHGMTTLAALHDLNLAASYCDVVFVMSSGEVVVGGPTAEVLADDTLATVFGIRVAMHKDPDTGHPRLFFSLPNAGEESNSAGTDLAPGTRRCADGNNTNFPVWRG